MFLGAETHANPLAGIRVHYLLLQVKLVLCDYEAEHVLSKQRESRIRTQARVEGHGQCQDSGPGYDYPSRPALQTYQEMIEVLHPAMVYDVESALACFVEQGAARPILVVPACVIQSLRVPADIH